MEARFEKKFDFDGKLSSVSVLVYGIWTLSVLLLTYTTERMTCICAGPFTMYFQPIEKKYFCSDKIFSVLIGGKDFEREEIDFALMDLDDPNNGKFYHYYYFYLSHYLAIMFLSTLIPEYVSYKLIKRPLDQFLDKMIVESDFKEVKFEKSKLDKSNFLIRHIFKLFLVIAMSISRILYFEQLLNYNFILGGFRIFFKSSNQIDLKKIFRQKVYCLVYLEKDEGVCLTTCTLPLNQIYKWGFIFMWILELLIVSKYFYNLIVVIIKYYLTNSRRFKVNKLIARTLARSKNNEKDDDEEKILNPPNLMVNSSPKTIFFYYILLSLIEKKERKLPEDNLRKLNINLCKILNKKKQQNLEQMNVTNV